jgi:hypothetical protein
LIGLGVEAAGGAVVFLQTWSTVQCLDEQTVERVIAMGSLVDATQGLSAVVADAVDLDLLRL